MLVGARSSIGQRQSWRSDPQIVITWDRPDAKPTIDGVLASDVGGELSQRTLDFSSWLVPESAALAAEAKQHLLERGEAFSLSAIDTQARHIEIEGRPVSGAAVIRIRDASGDRLRLAELRDAFTEKEESLHALRRALDAAGTPAWVRDQGGRLVWCNRAYAEAVEATDARAAVDAGAELFDPGDRGEAIKAVKELAIGNAEPAPSPAASDAPLTPSRLALCTVPPAWPATSPRSRPCEPRWIAKRITTRA